MNNHQLFWIKSASDLSQIQIRVESIIGFDLSNKSLVKFYQQYPNFYIFLCLLCAQGKLNPNFPSENQVIQRIEALIEAIRVGKVVGQSQLRWLALQIFSLAPINFLAFVKLHKNIFSHVLTDNYKSLVSHVNTTINENDQLLFHLLAPDFYLWHPADCSFDHLLICFTTSTGTLNMPLAVAHAQIAQLRMPTLYVINRPGILASEGLNKIGWERSAKILANMTGNLGYKKIYGLGTSIGGYQATLYSKYINFEKILSFSGASASDYPGLEIWNVAHGCVREKIMTVLSSTDPIDIKLLAEYQNHNYITPQTILKTPTHGTFTAAVIEGAFSELTQWLLKPV